MGSSLNVVTFREKRNRKIDKKRNMLWRLFSRIANIFWNSEASREFMISPKWRACSQAIYTYFPLDTPLWQELLTTSPQWGSHYVGGFMGVYIVSRKTANPQVVRRLNVKNFLATICHLESSFGLHVSQFPGWRSLFLLFFFIRKRHKSCLMQQRKIILKFSSYFLFVDVI